MARWWAFPPASTWFIIWAAYIVIRASRSYLWLTSGHYLSFRLNLSCFYICIPAMDPFSALGLASNVIQLVDFGSRLVSKSQELYKSADGISNVNRDLEAVTKDLTSVCSSLIQPEQYINKEQASVPGTALIPLCRSCKELGDELLSVLQTLKVKHRHQK